MKGYTVYAKNKTTGKGTGLEVSATKKETVKDGKVTGKEGNVTLRFFTLEEGDAANSMRFISTPVETFGLHLATLEVAKNGGKKTFAHKFTNEGKETTSEMILEKWEREGKSGYAMILKRDKVTINVPMDMTSFLYIGELLKTLSTAQAWNSYQGEEISEETGRVEEGEPAAGDSAVMPATEETVPAAEKPAVPAPTATSGNGSATGKVEAVRKDGKALKMNGVWFDVNDGTKLEGVTLAKGALIALQYAQSGKGKLATAISPAQ